MPNDPKFANGQQWNLYHYGQDGGVPGADIGAPAAWDIINSVPDVIVAIIDTGVCTTHEDIVDNLWTNPDTSSPFVHGINTAVDPPTGNVEDDFGHGASVAGVVGARGNNGKGVTGVSWQVKLMICKWMNGNIKVKPNRLWLHLAK